MADDGEKASVGFIAGMLASLSSLVHDGLRESALSALKSTGEGFLYYYGREVVEVIDPLSPQPRHNPKQDVTKKGGSDSGSETARSPHPHIELTEFNRKIWNSLPNRPPMTGFAAALADPARLHGGSPALHEAHRSSERQRRRADGGGDRPALRRVAARASGPRGRRRLGPAACHHGGPTPAQVTLPSGGKPFSITNADRAPPAHHRLGLPGHWDRLGMPAIDGTC